MKRMVLVGLVLIVIGALGLIYGGITYTKSRENVDLGIAQVQVENRERLTIHPAIGAVVLACGLVVTWVGRKSG